MEKHFFFFAFLASRESCLASIYIQISKQQVEMEALDVIHNFIVVLCFLHDDDEDRYEYLALDVHQQRRRL